MAYDYQKVKSAYEGLDAEQKKQFAEQNKNDANFQQFAKDYAAEMSKRSSTPTTTTTPTDNTSKSVREAWDKKSYQEQQDILNKNPSIREGLVKAGATFKTADTGETKKVETPTTPTTPTTSGDGWDYQDNSPERMRQIADNVNSFAITDPGLFENEQTFRKAFIDGKGRTKEQEDFLMDLYKNRKLYNTLDNYTADQIGYMDAHGELNNSYLAYLKNSDPERYAAVMDAKAKEVDKIKDASTLDTIGAMTGESEDVTTSKAIEWLKSQGLFLDKDGNLIDDRTENYASEEEKTYLKALSDLAARNLDIDNTVKHTYDDLVEKYPGATKATLMAMAQDRNSDLLREKENNLVELTRLQGYVGYMQSERQEMNAAGADSIRQLQDNLGMYYDYSPQGMAELAQAKYAATNITLDQADSGNETQKQMALQNVLDGYYDKYGDIIQRSEQQVINDVIAYAKKNGVGLAQALQENFVKRLQQKPQFATLSSGGTLGGAGTDKWDTVKITGADGKEKTVLYNQATGAVKNIDGTAYDGAIKTTAVGGATFKPVSKSAQTQALASVQSEYGTGSTYKNGWCGELANLYLQKMGSDIHLGDKIADKTKYITTKVGEGLPNIGDLVVRDFSSNPKASKVSQESGHVAVVTDVYEDGSFDVYQQNGDGKHTVGTAHIPNTNYVAGYIDPTAVSGGAGGAGDYSSANYMDYETGVLNFIPIQLRNTEKEQEKIVTKIKSYYDRGLGQTEAALVQMGFNVQKATPEGKNVANRIVDILSYVADEDAFDTTFMTMVSNDVNSGKYSEALKKTENMVYKYIQQSGQNAVSKTDISDAAVALSSLNKYKNSGSWLSNSTLTLENIISAGGKKVEQFNVRQANLINALEGLGYSEEMAQQLVPNLTMSRSAFVGKMDALQNLIIDRYNRQRGEYGMPPVNLAVLLGNQSLSTAYGVNSEGEALQVF